MGPYEKISNEELAVKLDQHELFLRSGKTQGEWAFLSNLDLSRRNLRGRDLRTIDFSWSSLKGADLTEAKIDDVHLGSTDLSHAKGLTPEMLKTARVVIDTVLDNKLATIFPLAKPAGPVRTQRFGKRKGASQVPR